ncbi:MAG: hypothetical protein JSR71_08245 [Proteobacteria bacterium]|nr:hypothetical protein [Pseudomonadota bacterium]
MAKIQFVEPNMYVLSGKNIHVSYSTSGFDGKPHFTYQDLHQTHSFSGDQIRRVETEIGTIVSVTTRLTIDSGGTTFSVLLPRVNLQASQSLPIHTEGITTVHRFSILPVIGQLDFYTITPLSGTAAQVFF